MNFENLKIQIHKSLKGESAKSLYLDGSFSNDVFVDLIEYLQVDYLYVEELHISNNYTITEIPFSIDRLVNLRSIKIKESLNLVSVSRTILKLEKLEYLHFSSYTTLDQASVDVIDELYHRNKTINIDGFVYQALNKTPDFNDEQHISKNFESEVEKIFGFNHMKIRSFIEALSDDEIYLYGNEGTRASSKKIIKEFVIHYPKPKHRELKEKFDFTVKYLIESIYNEKNSSKLDYKINSIGRCLGGGDVPFTRFYY